MNRWRVGEDRGSKETDRCPLTVGKGKRKVAPARAKVYAVVDGPVSRLSKSTSIHTNTYSYSATDV
jgi:hypothetical protein